MYNFNVLPYYMRLVHVALNIQNLLEIYRMLTYLCLFYYFIFFQIFALKPAVHQAFLNLVPSKVG